MWIQKQSSSVSAARSSFHLLQLSSLELHVSLQRKGWLWLDFWKMLRCVRHWRGESKGDMAYTVKRWASQHRRRCPPTPSSVSREPYLVEVGGPGLSLRGLSFICELFVCSVLHCHTALANLPNESQELHHSGKNKKKKKEKERKEMTARQHWQTLVGFISDRDGSFKYDNILENNAANEERRGDIC